MKDSHFDDIVNDCLERIAAGESVADCLERYPDQTDELAPILQMGQATMDVSQAARPSGAGRVRGMARMQAALEERRHRRAGRWHMPRISWRSISTPIAAAFAMVFLTAAAAGGTTVASADSIPGEPLYPVKSMRESVEERIARSDEHKAQVHAKLARERCREMRELIVRGRIYEAEVVASRLNRHLNESASRMGVVVSTHYIEMPRVRGQKSHEASAAALRQKLSHDKAYVKGQLTAVVEQVPEPHKRRVWRLMQQSGLGYRLVIVALDGSGEPLMGYYRYYNVRVAEPGGGQR
jgi:hypothetical protein